MRYLPALALLVSTLGIPAFGQRGGGMHGGGFSGGGMRSGGPSGGIRAGSGPSSGGIRSGSSGAVRGYASTRPGSPYARYGGTGSYARTPYGARPAFYSRNGNFYNSGSRFYGNNYGRRYGYGYGFPGLYNYGYNYPFYNSLLGDDDLFWGDYNPNNAPDSGQYAQQPYAPQQDPSQAYGSYAPQPDPSQAWQPPYPNTPPRPTSNPAPEDTTTLVFKDGRPPEQIRNYALSRTAIYVTGARIREIPLDQLDLAATVRANQAAGTPFQLP